MLGGKVVAEVGANGQWKRGYVYAGEQLVALQQNGQVNWVHQDPVSKSQRLTDASGNIVAGIELDPWGGETNRSWNDALQSHRFTSYERDSTGDESLFRRYHGWFSRFAQPDPYDGSYSLTNPQSFNRYAYLRNDPVNFVRVAETRMPWGQNASAMSAAREEILQATYTRTLRFS